MKVSTAELRLATELLLRHLDDTGQQEIEITEDFYWSVPENVRYDSYDEPTEHTVGQLSDDVGELKKMVAGQTRPTGRDLVWLAATFAVVARNARQ
jgi:hypothetical protein